MANVDGINQMQREIPQPDIIEEKIIKYNKEVQTTHYAKGRLLGKGGFAKCYEFTDLETKSISAAKIISKKSLLKARAKQKLISEIKIHKSLHNQHIVQFQHYFEDSDNVYILLEMCQNQSLNELLKRRKCLTELEVQCYAIQVLLALKYLHSHRIIHRDLKLGNLFLTDKMELKLGDFGLATKLEFVGERKRTVCGTPNYIAPEIFDSKHGHSYEVDIWSLGIVLYTLIIGKPPFETADVTTTYKKIKMNSYSFSEGSIISEPAKQLIRKILVSDPLKRPTLDEILSSEFFQIGISIPRQMPISTLDLPPSLLYMRIYMPDANSNGTVDYKKDSREENNIHLSGNSFDRKAHLTTTNVKDFVYIDHHENVTKNEDGFYNIGDKPQYNTLPCNHDLDTNNDMKSSQHNEIYIKKWIDYSNKYGIGYLLLNDAIGIFFNDNSKIVLQNNMIYYIKRKVIENPDDIFIYHLNDYPKDLHKKVMLLIHLKNDILGNYDREVSIPLIQRENQLDQKQNNLSITKTLINCQPLARPFPFFFNKDAVYVKKWMRTKHAMFFRLSNKIVQVCFSDHSEIILCSEEKLVIYLNKQGNRNAYELSSALESSNLEMVKRLKYTKDILTHMLSLNRKEKENKKKDLHDLHEKGPLLLNKI